MSGVTKTKKLVRTYERKEKQEKTVQKHADGVYFDKSSTKDEEDRTQKVEDEFFRDEDFKNSELDGNDDSKENGCKKSKKRLKKNCNESEGTKFPPRTSKRKLAKEKEDVKRKFPSFSLLDFDAKHCTSSNTTLSHITLNYRCEIKLIEGSDLKLVSQAATEPIPIYFCS